MNLELRAYRIGDKDRLVEILQQNVPAYFDESEVADFIHYLDQEVEQYFVAELDGVIVGSGGINFDEGGSIGVISWDMIQPEFQGKGIGGSLLKFRLDLLKSIKSVEKITVRTSQLTFPFYEKNGFVLLEIKKDYWAKGFDLYKMIYAG